MYTQGTIIDTISDTHTYHDQFKLPGGDILIHAGDCTFRGRPEEILKFLAWFADQDYSHLIMTPGNHDWGFQLDPTFWAEECKRRNIILLNDSGIEVENIKIWGSPVQPWFHNWAFNKFRGDDIKKHWDMIPEDTEILITHGPPKGILDDVRPRSVYSDHVGCEELEKRILQTKIKLHVFGHIHESRGYKYLDGRTYVNASALDGSYIPEKDVPIRVVKDIAGDYFVENIDES